MGQLEALFFGQRGDLFLMGKSCWGRRGVVYNQPIQIMNLLFLDIASFLENGRNC